MASLFERAWATLTRFDGQQLPDTSGVVTVTVYDSAGNAGASYANVEAIASEEKSERKKIGESWMQVFTRRFSLQVSTITAGVIIVPQWRLTTWDNVTYVIQDAMIQGQETWILSTYRKRN